MQHEISSPSSTICVFFVQKLKVDILVVPPVPEVPGEWALLVGIWHQITEKAGSPTRKQEQEKEAVAAQWTKILKLNEQC